MSSLAEARPSGEDRGKMHLYIIPHSLFFILWGNMIHYDYFDCATSAVLCSRNSAYEYTILSVTEFYWTQRSEPRRSAASVGSEFMASTRNYWPANFSIHQSKISTPSGRSTPYLSACNWSQPTHTWLYRPIMKPVMCQFVSCICLMWLPSGWSLLHWVCEFEPLWDVQHVKALWRSLAWCNDYWCISFKRWHSSIRR